MRHLLLLRKNKNTQAYYKLHLIIFIWGFTAILGALISLKAIPLVWYRIALALPFLFFWIQYKKLSLKISLKKMLNYAIGGFLIALHWVAFFMAIKVSNVSIALVTMSTGAFFTALIEPLFFKRKIRILEIFFGLLIVGGLYLIFQIENLNIYGVLWALLASFLSALFSVMNGLFVKNQSGFVLSFYQLFFGLLAITVFLLSQGEFSIDFFSITKHDWGYLLLLSSICTAYAFAVSLDIMKHLSPYTVMLSINLEPVYGILLALLIFGEKEYMGSNFYIGAVLILGIVLLNSILKTKKKRL